MTSLGASMSNESVVRLERSLAYSTDDFIMKGTKVQTLGARAVAGAWVAWARLAMGAIINTHAHH